MNSAPSSIFTKQAYVWMGAYWRSRRDMIPAEQWEREVRAFATALREESRSFTAVRFLQSCGYSRRMASQIAETL